MIQYRYTAYTPGGEAVQGKLSATDEQEAREQLDALRLTPVQLSAGLKEIRFDRPPGLREKALFMRQLANLLLGGVPQPEALRECRAGLTNPLLQTALKDLRKRVLDGQALSDAMTHHPKIFDEVMIAVVRAAQEQGELGPPLLRYSELLRWQLSIVAKVKKALAYPAVVLVLTLVVVWGLFTFVIPTLGKTVTTVGGPVPPLTAFVLGVAAAVGNPYVLVGALIGIPALIYFALRALKRPELRARVDAFLLRIPVFGGILQLYILARVSRTLADLLASGLPQLSALQLSSSVAGNAVYAQALTEAARDLEVGESIVPALKRYPRAFRPDFTALVQVGESKGGLDNQLKFLSNIYHEEVTEQVEASTTLIEPILIVFLGVIVGGTLLAVFMPLISVMQHLMGS